MTRYPIYANISTSLTRTKLAWVGGLNHHCHIAQVLIQAFSSSRNVLVVSSASSESAADGMRKERSLKAKELRSLQCYWLPLAWSRLTSHRALSACRWSRDVTCPGLSSGPVKRSLPARSNETMDNAGGSPPQPSTLVMRQHIGTRNENTPRDSEWERRPSAVVAETRLTEYVIH
ncbi:hypothetical protein Hypma_003525 [Hypsizygus marmoreus]|uniref:Uncharacterized protein n=1 Tax=Hypsizygus marmoreus TaxID=39966 RepID=A0A369JAQ2_HYPMA|nr:hypothetical protein Hypma_003525 [Hypsizygus marmoreus]